MLNGAINGPLHKSVVINCLPKLYIPSTLNNDLILWHTQLIVHTGPRISVSSIAGYEFRTHANLDQIKKEWKEGLCATYWAIPS